jgi:uncharacterized lipoprotein NlpE involved in copper resistance
MKPKKESTTSVVRNKYTAPFKEQALERADRNGIPQASLLKSKSSNKLNCRALNEKTHALRKR